MAFVEVFPFVAIILVESFAFYSFYRHPHGQPAVYAAPYAWFIDLLAIIGGSVFMYASAYALENPWIFTVDVHDALLWTIFLVGSWQAVIHAVKWFIRYVHHQY